MVLFKAKSALVPEFQQIAGSGVEREQESIN